MSLSTTVRRNDYTGNGSNSVFAYSFRIFAQADLVVKVKKTSTGTVTTLTLTTDYTVSGVGASAGGNVTLVSAGQAWLTAGKLSTGYTMTIRRIVSLVQNTDIRNQGSFFAETHEDSFDYLTMIDQQQQDAIDRSLHLSDTIDPTVFDTTLPADIASHAGETIVVNSGGTGFDLGGVPAAVPLYYVQEARPSDPPAGRLAFWEDISVSQSKKWSPFSNDWETIS